jgi:hypothetical protein
VIHGNLPPQSLLLFGLTARHMRNILENRHRPVFAPIPVHWKDRLYAGLLMLAIKLMSTEKVKIQKPAEDGSCRKREDMASMNVSDIVKLVYNLQK